jgi:phage-related protein
MTDIFVGSVSVGVVPDARGWEDKLRQQLIPDSRKIGDDVGDEIGSGITDKMSGAGDDSAKDFGTTFKERMKEILDSLPKAKIGGDATDVDAKIERLRKDLDLLGHMNIIDSDKAAVHLALIEGDVKALADASKNIKLDFNTKGALAKLAELKLLGDKVGVSAGGVGGKKDLTLSGAESAVSTVSGAASAGSGVLGNIMNFFGGLGGFFGGGGGGGGAAAAPAAAAPAAGPAAGAGAAAVPSLTAALVGAGAVAVPFIVQAIAGGIVAGLGSALAGVGILGAVMTGRLTKNFTDFSNVAKSKIKDIGTPFVPVIQNILKLLIDATKVMSPIFKLAMATIAGPIQVFAGTLIKAFMQPAVKQSILAIAGAFAALMKAMSPDVTGGMVSLAQSITRVADAVAKNPKAFADFVNFLFQIVIAMVNAIAYLTLFADWIEKNFPKVETAFKNIADWVKKNWAWDKWLVFPVGVFDTIITLVIKFHHDIAHWFDLIRHDVAAVWDGVASDTRAAFDGMRSWVSTTFDDIRHNVASFAGAVFNPIRKAYDSFQKWWQTNGQSAVIVWNFMWTAIKGAAQIAWQFLTAGFNILKNFLSTTWNIIVILTKGAWSTIEIIFKVAMDIISAAWNIFWGVFKSTVIFGFDAIKLIIKTAWDIVVGIITVGLDLLTGRWRNAWDTIKTVVEQIWNNIKSFFSDAGTWLLSSGEAIINGLLQGMLNVFKDITNWIKQYIYEPLLRAVKSVFGIHSAATSMKPIGKELITGVISGMIEQGKHLDKFVGDIFGGWPKALLNYIQKGAIDVSKLPKAAMSALSSVWGTASSAVKSAWGWLFGGGGTSGTVSGIGAVTKGVAQWAGIVSKALTLLGLPQSLGRQVLYQMQTESGGNPYAINLSDINAKMGDPSRGLLQVIGSTFAQYHVPGTSSNIYDPLANVASAINYARHVYGAGLMSGGRGMGSGHGYDSGGWLPTGVTLAYNMTGQPERILSPAESKTMAVGGTQYHAHFDGLTGAAIESHVRTAFQLMNMQQGAMFRQGRRS